MPNQQPSIDFLIQLSKEAGKILKEGFGKEHQVSYKGPINIVTEIDRKSEDMLVERIRGAFPKHSIVAEESGFLDGQNDHRWFIDPVDGTSNYAKALPIFCVSIGYAYQGKMRMAAVYDPMRDESFYAERWQGAWLNGERIHVTATDKLIDSMLVTGLSLRYQAQGKQPESFRTPILPSANHPAPGFGRARPGLRGRRAFGRLLGAGGKPLGHRGRHAAGGRSRRKGHYH